MTTAKPTEQLPTWTLDRVDPEKMKLLALLLADPNPIHFDPEAAPRLGVAARPVNQGPSNIAMLVNMLLAAYPGARLNRLRVQLRGSVVAGEPVRAGGAVIERADVAGGDRERVHCAVWLRVRDGEPDEATALTGEAELLVPTGGTR
jgi:3-hydroxybutyryl-CoA dehydratase